MAQIVSVVVSSAWRAKLAQIYQGSASFAQPLSFVFGEGGWTDPGSGKEPILASAALTNVTASGYPAGSQYTFAKALTGGDLTFTSPTRLEIRCLVSSGEANDDGLGNPHH